MGEDGGAVQHTGPSEKVEVSKLVHGEPWGRQRPRGLVGLFFFWTTQVPAMKEDKKNNIRGNTLDQAK